MNRKYGDYLVEYYADGTIRYIKNIRTGVFIIDENTLLFSNERDRVLSNILVCGYIK